MSFRIRLITAVLVAWAFGVVLLAVVRSALPHSARPFRAEPAEGSRRIRAEDAGATTAAFRRDLEVPGEVEHAWLRVSGDGGYEVVVNGDTVLRSPLWRPTRPFQNGYSEVGQRISQEGGLMGFNFPREYQWADHETASAPMWVDLTSALRAGPNAICIESESRSADPTVAVEGEVLLKDGRRLPILSDAEWVAEPVPPVPAGEDWMARARRPHGWRRARDAGPAEPGLSIVPRGTYESPFRAARVTAADSGESRVVEFTETFTLDRAPDEAFVRVMASAPYSIRLNGRPLECFSREKSLLRQGEWQVRETGREVLEVAPEPLDPDEVGTLLPGEAYQNPRHGDPTADAFKRSENTLNRTRERPTGTKAWDVQEGAFRSDEKGRLSDRRWGIERPDASVPPSVVRSRGQSEFTALGVGRLLKAGENRVSVRLHLSPWAAYSRSWRPWVAMDVGGRDGGAPRRFCATGENTSVTVSGAAAGRAAILPEAGAPAGERPPLKFVGNSVPPSPALPVALSGTVIAGAGSFALIARSRRWCRLLVRRTRWFSFFGVFAAAALLLETAFAERSEIVFWRSAAAGPLTVALACVAATLVLRLGRRRVFAPVRRHAIPVSVMAVAALLALCALVRGWGMDRQPLDDDEYASVQAALAIAEKGVPEYQEGVWYTRSPLYHYPAGVIALLTGGSLQALRLYSVASAVATAALVWWWALRLSAHRAVALGALALFTLHPYLIATAHVARFYQQQQLLSLFSAYLFVRGFVETSDLRLRFACVGVFTAAVLSQEITLLQAIPMLLCYAAFAKPAPLGEKLRLAFFSGCCAAIIALNLAFFQIRCLTALDGVSPNVEATLGLRFADPGNVFAMAAGYSRLHLFLSPFAAYAMFAALRRRDPVVLCLSLWLVLGVLSANFLITSSSFRYQYSLIPLWILLCMKGMADVSTALLPGPGRSAGRAMAALLLMAMGVASWSPWRIPGSYGVKLVGDSTGALAYVRANLRPGDKVAITEPHPHAALLETGRSDYDLAVPILYDFVVKRDGRLVDRNGGAEVIAGVGDMQRVLAGNDRVWIVVNREKFRSRTRNIRWEYPGARLELFLRENTRLAHRTYLWSVFLWDAQEGRLKPFRETPGTL